VIDIQFNKLTAFNSVFIRQLALGHCFTCLKLRAMTYAIRVTFAVLTKTNAVMLLSD